MSFTTKCPKCSVGIISFDYQGEQAYGLEQEPIAEALMYEDQSCECELTPAEIEDLEDETLKDLKEQYSDDYDESDWEEYRFRHRL